jgi:hypothetical protein
LMATVYPLMATDHPPMATDYPPMPPVTGLLRVREV